jgi:hypothetical protein
VKYSDLFLPGLKSFLSRYLFKNIAVALVCAAFFLPSLTFSQFYNGSQMEFGKNRIQHDEFLWTFYRFDKFDTYFYPGGKDLAVYTAKTALAHLTELEDLFDYEMESKIQFVLYNKQSHFRQSNIGIGADERYNIGGVTRIVGSKVFLYFEGDHAKLDAQIRSGIAEILLNEMLYGGDWREIMRNSAMLVLPDWYLKGLISYVSDPWNVNVENFAKDAVLSGKYDKFNRLTGDEAIYAGHSLWHFIAETYGRNVLSNVIYMTHVSRNVESGFLFVLGSSLKTLTSDWVNFYKSKYAPLEDQRSLPLANKLKTKTKPFRVYSQLKLSPDGRYVAFVSNELGQYKVWMYDIEKKKRRRIVKKGHKLERVNDYSYPLLSWHPSGKMLAIMLEEKAKPELWFYLMDEKKIEKKPIFTLDKVIDFDYSDDGRNMVFSGVFNGQSDIYLYNIGANTQQQLTNDVFDDLNPRFINNSKKIIFSSNRVDDTLRTSGVEIKSYNSNKDIFIYDLQSKKPLLTRITNTPLIDESQPMEFSKDKYTFLSNENRVKNRFVAEVDSVISHIDTIAHYRYFTRVAPLTNSPRNIIEHEVYPELDKISEIIFYNGRYGLYAGPTEKTIPDDFGNFDQMPFPLGRPKLTKPEKPKAGQSSVSPVRVVKEEKKAPEPSPPASPSGIRVIKEEKKNQDTIAAAQVDTSAQERPKFKSVKAFEEEDNSDLIDINNYQFSGTYKEKPAVQKLTRDTVFAGLSKTVEQEMPEPDFILPNLRNYNVTYFTDYIVSQVDNNFANMAYQPFMGGSGYNNPGMNGLFKLGISDLFENHKIVGAVRLSPNLSTNEYFLSYENLEKRLDKQYIFHRQGMMIFDRFAIQKVHIHEVKNILKWPISEVASFRLTSNLRQDRMVTLATDFQNLQTPNVYNYWGNSKLEFVFDNVLNRGINLYNGTRYKIFAEYYRRFWSGGNYVGVLGFDFRNYKKIHRDLIWANRLAGSTSFGTNKLIYFMGGVDNWLIPRFDQTNRIDFSQNYVFQALATNMRGFHQNARNGNNFMVLNSELRWPIFRYLMNQPIKSDFVNNFQIIGFGDIGTAWTGLSPYSDDNTLNTEIIYANPFIITLRNQREPIIGGYGFGLRSRIWGYFVRADWAWGVEDGVVQPRVFYLSLSLDF